MFSICCNAKRGALVEKNINCAWFPEVDIPLSYMKQLNQNVFVILKLIYFTKIKTTAENIVEDI